MEEVPCYIAYGLAIFAAVLTVAFTAGYLPRDATASHSETNGTISVRQLEESSGAKALPRRKSLTRSIGNWRLGPSSGCAYLRRSKTPIAIMCCVVCSNSRAYLHNPRLGHLASGGPSFFRVASICAGEVQNYTLIPTALVMMVVTMMVINRPLREAHLIAGQVGDIGATPIISTDSTHVTDVMA